MHNVSLGQYTISVGDGLMGLRFSSSKNDEQPTIFRRPCDRWRHILSYWCPCNHEAKRSLQGKKGIIGKGDWCLRPRWTFWCDWSYVEATGIVLCVWGEGGSRCIQDHVVSFVNLFVICCIGWFCTVFVSLPHIGNLEYFITSSS